MFSALFLTLLVEVAFAKERIYGGCPVDIMKASYMAQVIRVIQAYPDGTAKTYVCGGSILEKNLIMTAGHCTKNATTGEVYKADRYYINVAANDSGLSGGVLHRVKNVFTHSKYMGGDDNHYFHDIGLLELVDDITLNERSQLVNLAQKNDTVTNGTDGIVSGWGMNPDHPNDNRLYQVHLTVITAQSCSDQLAGGSVEEIDKHQICAQAPGKNFCPGDSGGPFIDTTTNRQIGVVSYGATNCTTNTPSIFCRITDNLDFIHQIIKKITKRKNSLADKILSSLKPSMIPKS